MLHRQTIHFDMNLFFLWKYHINQWASFQLSSGLFLQLGSEIHQPFSICHSVVSRDSADRYFLHDQEKRGMNLVQEMRYLMNQIGGPRLRKSERRAEGCELRCDQEPGGEGRPAEDCLAKCPVLLDSAVCLQTWSVLPG